VVSVVISPDPVSTWLLSSDLAPWSWATSVKTVVVSTWPAAVIEVDIIPSSVQLGVALPAVWLGGQEERLGERGDHATWTTSVNTLDGEDDLLVEVNIEGLGVW